MFTSSLAFITVSYWPFFIVHGISLVKSYSISSWVAKRKMSELRDHTAKPKRRKTLTQSNRYQIRTQNSILELMHS